MAVFNASFRRDFMIKSKIKVKLDFDIVKVWNKITYLENYTWRSGFGKIKIINNSTFIINSQSKNSTLCKFTFAKLYRQWELKLENKHYFGVIKGFLSGDENHCVIEFDTNLKPKKMFLLPFIKDTLKKQQQIYINDLKKALLNETQTN